MNPFKAIAETARLIRLRSNGLTALKIGDDAAARPELYEQPSYWERLLTVLRALALDLPLPPYAKGLLTMKNWKTALAGIAALVGVAAKVVNGHFDPTTDSAIAMGAIGLLFAKDHDVTGGTRQQ